MQYRGITLIFHASVLYVIDYEFRHNILIVKVALDPRREAHYAHCINKSMCPGLHSFFLYIFYKNIEAEIRIKNKAEAEILKRIDIILCVETSVNTIQYYVFNLTV